MRISGTVLASCLLNQSSFKSLMDLHEDRHWHTAWLMNFMTKRVTGDVRINTSLSFPRSELNNTVANAHCCLVYQGCKGTD